MNLLLNVAEKNQAAACLISFLELEFYLLQQSTFSLMMKNTESLV